MSEVQTSRPVDKQKVLILVTEDWFLLSHFRPLVRALAGRYGEVVVATGSSGRAAEIEALGARVVTFGFDRASMRPARQVAIVQGLRRVIAREDPDVVHAIALKPIALGGLAFASIRNAARGRRLVMHLTGSGPVGTMASGRVPVAYAATVHLMRWLLRRPDTALLVENPDDAARIAGDRSSCHGRVTVLGGAGVNPDEFFAASWQPRSPMVVGFLGRMLSTKGVGDLVTAHQTLRAANALLDLHLGGTPDPGNRWAIDAATLERWSRLPGVKRLGHVADAPAFWRGIDIAVVPSSWGEGMPRVLLEAAATARPLVVTDVPGCRYFVRHEREGLIVPPDDVAALAAALARLAGDPAFAGRLGQNARARLLDGFTERHVAEAVLAAYMRFGHS